MKKLLLTAALALCAAASVARAQDNGTPITPMPNGSSTPAPGQVQGQGGGQARPMPSSDQIVTMMAQKLSLTADQQAKIAPIVAERRQKMQALQADSSGRGMQRARKMKEILDEADKQITPILTPDQRKQYAAMEAEQREKMKERMQARKAGDAL